MRLEEVKKTDIQLVVGISFILFGIICHINVGYIAQSIVLGLAFIFGFFAYWFIFPSFILFGVFLIIYRKRAYNFKINQLLIGVGLLFFSLLVLLTVIPYPAVGVKNTNIVSLNFLNFNQLFYDSWLKSIRISRFNGYYEFNRFSYTLGGGWFGHFLAGLFSFIGKGGAIAMSSILLLISLILIFNKEFKLLFNKIKTKIASKKKIKLNEEEYNIGNNSSYTSLDAHPSNFDPTNEKEDNALTGNELSQANLFSSDEEPDFDSVGEDNQVSGQTLHAATFMDEDAPVTASKPVTNKVLAPYKLPSLDLLKTYEISDAVARNEENCASCTAIINSTFQYLRIGAKVVGHTIGPRVTRYDIQVDADASIQAIPRYVSDISQRLGGVNARFEPIVTGKVTSGLEVPNKETTMIGFREIVSALPQGDKYALVMPFGKNITGEIKYGDLAKFPHMLIGGTTGSGKSVFVNSIIMTYMMRDTPEQVRLLLIDPKRVEFTRYKNSPFLLCPVVTDPKKAKVALTKLAEEMDRRYSLFESLMVNNIISYNQIMKSKGQPIMPYIVTIVDEFSDLIIQNKKIDLDINRIAAKARAAGIHLIIATQRPSVDVITGVIKSNLSVRVALSVPDIESSKTIIGGMGAEQLLGNGDMLVVCPQVQANGCARVQGCYVADDEIMNVVNFINAQREPNYDPRFMDLEDHTIEEVKSDEPKMSAADARKLNDDNLYEFIKEQAYKREYTSISVIERENGIGFTRAGRFFKRLQDEGLVSLESEASKGSKVIKENFHFEKKEPKIGSEEVTTVTPNNDEDNN